MNAKKKNTENSKVKELAVEYEVQKPEFRVIERETFDFDAEFANGLTPDEFREEMIKRVKSYPWKK